MRKISFVILVSCCLACARPSPGPDKTVGGAILGAGWGAGAGAVVGNQVDNVGPGAAIGAGIGMVNGAMGGYAYDAIEGETIQNTQELRALEVQNSANSRQLAMLQRKLDQALVQDAVGGIYQVFFDADGTNLKAGAIANLEAIADGLKTNPYVARIQVVGHSDDAGTPDYNQRLAEARARAVAAYLTARGISSTQIVVNSFGATRPIASNTSETGRQLNRRVDILIGAAVQESVKDAS